MVSSDEKELLWMYLGNGIDVLVPKKRGSGYLLQPYGHHNNSLLNDAVWRVEGCDGIDIFGLDGSLELRVNKYDFQDPKRIFATALMDSLSTYYGWPHREVKPNEYWTKHPIGMQ
ncbi:TPA: hypothetical protein ACF3XO_004512 [Vibrio parahaemolyticus]